MDNDELVQLVVDDMQLQLLRKVLRIQQDTIVSLRAKLDESHRELEKWVDKHKALEDYLRDDKYPRSWYYVKPSHIGRFLSYDGMIQTVTFQVSAEDDTFYTATLHNRRTQAGSYTVRKSLCRDATQAEIKKLCGG